MRSLRRQWREIDRAVRGDVVSEGRTQHNRDPLAIVVAVLGLITQIGTWIWWGGRIDERVEAHETRIAAVEQRAQQREDAKSIIDGVQTTQIAVITTQLESIKSSVDRIDRKIPERR